MTPYVALWRAAFVLALLTELPIVALAAPSGKRLRATLASLAGNAATHPALWFLWPRLMPQLPALLFGEVIAVVVEAALMATLGGLPKRRALLIALAANAYSWVMMELITRWLAPALASYWWGR